MQCEKKRGTKHDAGVFTLTTGTRVAVSRDKEEKYKRHWFGKDVLGIRGSVPDINLQSLFDVCMEVSAGWLGISV